MGKSKFEIGDTVRVKSKYDGTIDENDYEVTDVIPNPSKNTYAYSLTVDGINYGLYEEEQLYEVL